MTGTPSYEVQKKYLTPEELCLRWNGVLTAKTLANWRYTGEGPSYTKLGGRIVYRIEAVERYEQERERRLTISSTGVF